MAGLLIASAVAASCLLATWTFRLATRWGGAGDRRLLVLWAMAAPGLVLGVLLGGASAMVLEGCPLFTPFDQILVMTIAGSFLAFVVLACLRHVRQAMSARRALLAISEAVIEGKIHDQLGDLARRLGVPRPELRIIRTSRPLACTLGFRKPVVILSTGLLATLDTRECEAVLAHELAHLRQNDHVVAFLIAWLRDGLFYVPGTREGWERYRHDREIACDAMSAGATGRPGALASALFKVGAGCAALDSHVADFGPQPSEIEARLEHLLGDSSSRRGGRAAVGYGIVAAGAMATILALSPIWYMPVCMTVFCRIGL